MNEVVNMESLKPSALEQALRYYYSSGFWTGFVLGVVTGVSASVTVSAVVRWRRG